MTVTYDYHVPFGRRGLQSHTAFYHRGSFANDLLTAPRELGLPWTIGQPAKQKLFTAYCPVAGVGSFGQAPRQAPYFKGAGLGILVLSDSRQASWL